MCSVNVKVLKYVRVEAKIIDYSMLSIQDVNNTNGNTPQTPGEFGQDALNDLTDLQNDEFIVRLVSYPSPDDWI